MRAMLALWMMICATSAIAVECGPKTSAKSLEAHLERIDRLRENVDIHIETLQKQVETSIQSVQNDSAISKVDRLQNQLDVLVSADLAGERLSSVLMTPLAIARIRDVMLDTRDIKTVDNYLSLSLPHIHAIAGISHRAINRSFAKIMLPAALHDVSRLRDAIGEIAATYEECTKPNP